MKHRNKQRTTERAPHAHRIDDRNADSAAPIPRL